MLALRVKTQKRLALSGEGVTETECGRGRKGRRCGTGLSSFQAQGELASEFCHSRTQGGKGRAALPCTLEKRVPWLL